MGISPTSSRNKVPPSASSMRPTFWLTAPVNAPFSWPNSSLSRRPVGMAAQLTLMKGPSLRRLRRWRACANSSLPVPVSPRSKTVAPLGATVANDFRKSALAVELALQVFCFFRQTAFESIDFGCGPLIFESDGELGGNLIEQSQVFRVKCIGAGAAQHQHSEYTLRPVKRNTT